MICRLVNPVKSSVLVMGLYDDAQDCRLVNGNGKYTAPTFCVPRKGSGVNSPPSKPSKPRLRPVRTPGESTCRLWNRTPGEPKSFGPGTAPAELVLSDQ